MLNRTWITESPFSVARSQKLLTIFSYLEKITIMWNLKTIHSHIEFISFGIHQLLKFWHLATVSFPYNLSQSNLNLDNGTDAATFDDSTEVREKFVVLLPLREVLVGNCSSFPTASPASKKQSQSAAGISSATIRRGTSAGTVAASSSVATSISWAPMKMWQTPQEFCLDSPADVPFAWRKPAVGWADEILEEWWV